MLTYEEFCVFIEEPYLISFDNNIILDLYRNPPNNSKSILSLFDKITDNTLVTNQAYEEYLKNYHHVKGNEKKKYSKVTKDLKEVIEKASREIESKIKGYTRYNYSHVDELKNDLLAKINEMTIKAEKYTKEHTSESTDNLKFIESDYVYTYINELRLQGKILNKISYTKKLQILQEGKIRYQNSLPPGYKDADKPGIEKYGDLFLWKELISIPQEKNSNLIFITNDTKDDWWKKDKYGNCDTLRDELKEEFLELNTNYKIEFLSLEKFYNYMSRYLNIQHLSTTLDLGKMSIANKIMNQSSLSNIVETALIDAGSLIELSDYINVEFDGSVMEWNDWRIKNGIVSIIDDFALYSFDTVGNIDYEIYFEDDEGTYFDIGDLNVKFDGEIEVKKKINEDFSVEDELILVNISFKVNKASFMEIKEYGKDEESYRADMMDTFEDYYSD